MRSEFVAEYKIVVRIVLRFAVDEGMLRIRLIARECFAKLKLPIYLSETNNVICHSLNAAQYFVWYYLKSSHDIVEVGFITISSIT